MYISRIACELIEAALDQPFPTLELRKALEDVLPVYERQIQGDVQVRREPRERRA